MIFRGKPHAKLFDHESWLRPTGNNRFTAALYLLTADTNLWNQVQDAVSVHDIRIEEMHPRDLSVAGYVFFRIAKDIVSHTETVSISSLVSPATISPTDFLVICTAMCISGFGVKCAERIVISE